MLLAGSLSVPKLVLEGEAANYPCVVIPAPAVFERGKVVLTVIK